MDNAAEDVSVWIVILLAIIVVVGLFHYSDKVIEYKEHKIKNSNLNDGWKYENINPNETMLEVSLINSNFSFPVEVFFIVNGTTKIDMILYKNGTVEDYYYSKR